MQQFTTFNIRWYTWDTQTCTARFQYDFDNKKHFEEVIDFSHPDFEVQSYVEKQDVVSLLFHTALAFGASYYKAFPTKTIVVHTWYLSQEQSDHRTNFYRHSLSEFFFVNKLDPKDLCVFQSQSSLTHTPVRHKPRSRALVPIGWWKDSCVSVEICKKKHIDFDIFTFGKAYILHKSVADVICQNSDTNWLVVKRTIDPVLFEMNDAWYYNWHVSITWLIAFASLVVAYLYDYKRIVLSNEKSANYGNTTRKWFEVNHQYSKSLEFEQWFKAYTSTYVVSGVSYFSLLRWWYEIAIAKQFAQYPHYFTKASSCNKNFLLTKSTTKRRCCACPKCAFVFAMLRPYITHQQMLDIFWEDLFANEWLADLFKELLWIKAIKPLECVWTPEEVSLAMYKCLTLYQNKDTPLPVILDMFVQESMKNKDTIYFDALEQEYFRWYDEHIIPDSFLPVD